MKMSGYVARAAVSMLALSATPAFADAPLSIAPIFSDNMVLQRGKSIPITGSAQPGANIQVQIDAELPISAIADETGHWKAQLPGHAAGGPHKLAVTSKGTLGVTFANIRFGDVFLCSGQSNMEFTLRHATNADVFIAQSANVDLRLFNVPRQSSITPQTQFASPAKWAVSAPDTTPDFSAACYFMGAELQQNRRVPVGLIAASWGGSVIQDWMPPQTLKAVGGYDKGLSLLELRARDTAAADRLWGETLVGYLGKSAAKLQAPQPADITHFWESWGNPDLAMFDGTGIFRTTVTLTADQAKAARSLSVGRVDDIDQTLVNGQIVGSTMGWDTLRSYAVKPGLLHAGSNTIEVRVIDTGGGGGMWGTEPRALVLADGKTVPIDGPWQFVRGASLSEAGAPPYVPWIGGSGLTTLFNGMIAPIGEFPLAGIAWYQGESNVSDAAGYARLLPAMMAEWRKRFSTQSFAMAQLANFGPLRSAPAESVWAELREAQRRVVAADSNAGMAVTIDIGDPYDIHPTNKRDVGHRLALAIDGRGKAPLPQVRRDGGQVILHFDRALNVVGNDLPIGFEACEIQGKCRFAAARKTDANSIAVEAGNDVRYIRYLWADSPITNLFGPDGVPISPFEAAIP